jgi:hypothetical protein
MKETLPSLASSPIPEAGATDSPWQPSFLHWLISALSGTVEIEKQTAWLAQNNEEFKKSNGEFKKKNNRLAELESKLNEILHS